MSSSKTYFNTFYKRVAQHYLLSHVKINYNNNYRVTGFAGDNPFEYREILNQHFNPQSITLCDKDKYLPGVYHTDILNLPVTNVIDLDFEGTYITCGETALEMLKRLRTRIFNKQGKPVSKYLAITFSLRATGIQKTLEWLNKNLYKNTLSIAGTEIILKGQSEIKCAGYVKTIVHTQSTFKESVMVQYADTSHMLSLIVRF